jgi:hypothetical protein
MLSNKLKKALSCAALIIFVSPNSRSAEATPDIAQIDRRDTSREINDPTVDREKAIKLTGAAIAEAAEASCSSDVRYDPSYAEIPYPGGDIPLNKGVCADVIIRTFRGALGIDLQKLVHEDMLNNFDVYPSRILWGLKGPDANIDHRRVPNLAVYFERNGQVLPTHGKDADYRPGDIVVWNLTAETGGSLPHIGIVATIIGKSDDFMVVHNIGRGTELSDSLYEWQVTGHFRYPDANPSSNGVPLR